MGDITAKWTRWDQNKNIRVIVDASERRVCESEWSLVLSVKEILLPHKSNTGSLGGEVGESHRFYKLSCFSLSYFLTCTTKNYQ